MNGPVLLCTLWNILWAVWSALNTCCLQMLVCLPCQFDSICIILCGVCLILEKGLIFNVILNYYNSFAGKSLLCPPVLLLAKFFLEEINGKSSYWRNQVIIVLCWRIHYRLPPKNPTKQQKKILPPLLGTFPIAKMCDKSNIWICLELFPPTVLWVYSAGLWNKEAWTLSGQRS